jgi:hypothetical protein
VRDLPGDGVLIWAEKGWFVARTEKGAVTVDRVGNADTGGVFDMGDLSGGGVLIRAAKGLFLAHMENGAATVDLAGNPDMGRVLDMRSFPTGGVLIQAEKGWFLARVVNGAHFELIVDQQDGVTASGRISRAASSPCARSL